MTETEKKTETRVAKAGYAYADRVVNDKTETVLFENKVTGEKILSTETETKPADKWDAKLVVSVRGYHNYANVLPGGFRTECEQVDAQTEIEAVRWTVAMLRALKESTEAKLMRLLAEEDCETETYAKRREELCRKIDSMTPEELEDIVR